MQIAEDVYQTSGVIYGTNSNTYVIRAGHQLIMIDAGCNQFQYEIIVGCLKRYGLSELPVTHVFVTHLHYDHVANLYRFAEAGAQIIVGAGDTEPIEEGNDLVTIANLFDSHFIPCKVDYVLKDDSVLEIGNKKIKAISMPGHTKGSYMFEVNIKGEDILFTGDNVFIQDNPPCDEVKLVLAWTGGVDYSRQNYLSSLKKATSFKKSILLAGHFYPYFGDSREIFRRAYEKGVREL